MTDYPVSIEDDISALEKALLSLSALRRVVYGDAWRNQAGDRVRQSLTIELCATNAPDDSYGV